MYAGRLGHAGFRDGPRQLALFSAPRGMCADTNRTLIVADSDNACIRRIVANGELVLGDWSCSPLFCRDCLVVVRVPKSARVLWRHKCPTCTHGQSLFWHSAISDMLVRQYLPLGLVVCEVMSFCCRHCGDSGGALRQAGPGGRPRGGGAFLSGGLGRPLRAARLLGAGGGPGQRRPAPRHAGPRDPPKAARRSPPQRCPSHSTLSSHGSLNTATRLPSLTACRQCAVPPSGSRSQVELLIHAGLQLCDYGGLLRVLPAMQA